METINTTAATTDTIATTSSNDTASSTANNDSANDNEEILDAHISAADGSPMELKKNIGLISAVSYVMGGIIGVGIFVSPQSVLLNVGKSVGVSLCVWAFCALLAFCGALTYVELGTRISKSGGTYTYVREAFGDGAGFVILWLQMIVVRPLAAALASMAAAEYALRPMFMDCPDLAPRPGKVLIALCLLGFLVFLNCYGTSWGAAYQTLSTVCKVSALGVIIIIGIVYLCKEGGSVNFEDPFSPPEELTAAGLSLAIFSCTYAYAGWDNLNLAIEEVKNPKRNIPLAILLAEGLTAAAYLLAIVSYHAVLTTPQIVSGVAVAAVFVKMTVSPLLWIIVPCIAISASGIVNAIIFVTSRFTFIGGRDSLFPEVLSMIHRKRKTPLVSCLVLGVAAGIVILIGDVKSVLGAYGFFRSVGETVAILGVVRLRRKFPASPTTYVAPSVAPIFYLVVNVSLAVVAVTRDTSRYIVPLLFTLAGIPVYFLSTTRMFRKGPMKRFNDSLVDVCRKLLVCEFASKEY